MGKYYKGREWSDLGDFQMLVVVKILVQQKGAKQDSSHFEECCINQL